MLEVIETLLGGGVAVYPTETLYALGCDATNPAAARRVVEIKARPESKPLPILVGSMHMLESVVVNMNDTVVRLARAFWPGPLSVLVESTEELAPQVRDENGMTSVRWTPHPLAVRLCRELGSPLVATSANISGRPPTAVPSRLDAELMELVDDALLEKPWPAGGRPSTLVSVNDDGSLTILREGAVYADALRAKGFSIGG
ncbi:MAG: L-threonylcarbamoyladenylate synthase [Desulfovibrionaceae bacterium]